MKRDKPYYITACAAAAQAHQFECYVSKKQQNQTQVKITNPACSSVYFGHVERYKTNDENIHDFI